MIWGVPLMCVTCGHQAASSFWGQQERIPAAQTTSEEKHVNILGKIVRTITDTVDDFIAYDQGADAGEAWKANGGGPVDDEMLHQIHISRGLETRSWPAWNRGFVSEAGSCESDEEE